MGALGFSLLVFFIWFIKIVKGSPLEITCYLGIAVSIILMLLAVYAYYYKKPVLTFNDTGLIYYSLGKPPLKFEWENIKELEYSLQPWREVPSTITVIIILKNNAMMTIGLRKLLIHKGKTINAKQTFELLKTFLNGN